MSGGRPEMPASLRQAVADDLSPVRPLSAPWVRVLWTLPLAAVMSVGTLIYFGIRPDAGALGPLLAWVPLAMQATIGITLLAMALYEAVPGMRIPRGAVFAVSFLALALHLTVNVLIWLRYPMGYEDFLASWWDCFHYEFLLGIPFLVGITYLAAHALPLNPPVIGLLAGIGGGVIADASWRMVCPVSVPSHFLTAHLGGIVVLGSAGLLLGLWIQRRQTR